MGRGRIAGVGAVVAVLFGCGGDDSQVRPDGGGSGGSDASVTVDGGVEGDGGASPRWEVEHPAFVTSTTGSADLSTWESDGPWVRPDGVLVGTKADLEANQLWAPPNLADDGRYLPYGIAWTGGGCEAWTVGDETAATHVGNATRTTRFWAMSGNQNCVYEHSIYCFEDG